ncbi:TonB-dependent receptor [Vibrio penaeicida]|uniref:TonB-dependent receptor domain-containing protein n=1 Tax=Vibrio penaeicida TaxID=104609 RepID=UPI0027327D0A|nr:TonB-dependent receptor [Vibrio penaeicida]MDP2573976.1 TonB-dependent receptor [Vibrio penaeicida]
MKVFQLSTVAMMSAVSFVSLADEVMTVESQIQAEMDKSVIDSSLEQVAGGTNLIDTSELRGSQSSLAKVLSQQTGIVVQEFFGGNDQPRINIRGSGIQDNPVNRGIQLLHDGLALNQADGSFVIGIIDPEQARLISAYRGANGMRYGATTLGGAINFHSKTGLNSPSEIQLEGGSFGFYKGSATLSERKDAWDFWLNAASSQRDGYRTNSSASRKSVALNLGYTAASWQNRSYITYSNNDFQIPFLLTKQRAVESSSEVMGESSDPMDELLNIPIREPFRRTEQIRLANKTHWYGDDSEFQAGFYFEKLDDQFRNPLTQANTLNQNIGLDASAKLDFYSDDYLLRELLFFTSVNIGEMPRDIASVHPSKGTLMPTFASMDLSASNIVLGAQLQYEVIQDLSAIASIQWVNNQRTIKDKLNLGVLDSQFSYTVVNPKVGFNYRLNENKRVYANVSASSEAPNFWQLATVSANPTDPLNNHVYINDLSMQTALTGEVGADVEIDEWIVNASWYYSQVSDELISVVGDFAVNGKTINYDGDTIHHGVETAISHQTHDALQTGDVVSSRLLYNWSHFYFKDGLYKGNRIAGVPVHLIQGQVDYLMASGLRVIPNFSWQPTENYTDHLNSGNTQDPYFLLGFKVGYEASNGVEVFVDINNLTNTTYQTAYAIRGQGAAELPTFIPGPGINGIIGVKYQW